MPYVDILKTLPNGLLTWACGEAGVAMHAYSEEQVKKVVLAILKYYTGKEINDQQCRLIR